MLSWQGMFLYVSIYLVYANMMEKHFHIPPNSLGYIDIFRNSLCTDRAYGKSCIHNTYRQVHIENNNNMWMLLIGIYLLSANKYLDIKLKMFTCEFVVVFGALRYYLISNTIAGYQHTNTIQYALFYYRYVAYYIALYVHQTYSEIRKIILEMS